MLAGALVGGVVVTAVVGADATVEVVLSAATVVATVLGALVASVPLRAEDEHAASVAARSAAATRRTVARLTRG